MASIGALNTPLELIGLTRTETADGGWTRTDQVEAMVFAYIRPANASEQYRAMRNEVRISHMIEIRFDPDLAEKIGKGARARWTDQSGRVREVRIESAMDPDEKGRRLVIQAIEGGPR
ncbi:MAG TPA: phage head closure protein [Terricaulis sp.]|nr:phage head closure protein [Terricaulis sp.]